MNPKRLNLGMALFFALAGAAWSGGIPDPAMGIMDDSNSNPVSQINGAFPITPQNGGGVFRYFNDTGMLIVGLDFHTTAAPGLNSDQIAAFICNADDGQNPFFLNCRVAYNGGSGALTVSFFGVNPPDGDGVDGDPGDKEGIAATPPCPIRFDCFPSPLGHFLVTLNDGYCVTCDDSGGWDKDPFFPNGPAEFDVDVRFAVPEPATFLLFSGALLGVCVYRKARVKPRV